MSRFVNVALAGIAGYGDLYLEALLHHPRSSEANARLVAVADPASHRCERLHELKARGIAIYDQLDSLLAAHRVDLVMIATPIYLHASHTCLALEHGANVLCEKPLASSLSDALRMLACEERHRHFVAIGYQWSFSDAVQTLKRDILSGVLGRPMRLRTLAFFPRGVGYFRRNDWAGQLQMPGGEPVLDSPVNNATAHYLHNMLYLLGPTRATSAMPVTVQAELYRANDIRTYDTAALRIRTESDVELLFYTSHSVAEQFGPVCRFEFENALVEYDPAEGGEFVARFHDGAIRRYGSPNLDRHQKVWQCIEAARAQSPASIACGIRAALPHTLCVLAAQESTRDIASFAQSLQKLVPNNEDKMVVIEGLGEALMECCRRAILPSEHGHLHWSIRAATVRVPAVPAPTIDVQTFVQPFQPAHPVFTTP